MAFIKTLSNIEQRFYRYELWEDYQSGMYNSPPLSKDRINKAIECLSDETICREFMEKVVIEWQIATEQVLTNPESNGRAWLGQCACFMYGGCYDEETRKVWCMLPPQTQKKANQIAEQVIYKWMSEFSKQCPNYQFRFTDLGVTV